MVSVAAIYVGAGIGERTSLTDHPDAVFGKGGLNETPKDARVSRTRSYSHEWFAFMGVPRILTDNRSV